MKPIKYIQSICLIALSILIVSCHKEAALQPSTVFSFNYALPQGKHTYDDTIVSFYKKYNCFILYKFNNDQDFRWTLGGGPMLPTYAMPADTNFISPVVSYILGRTLYLYSDTFLQKVLPYKILLSGGFESLTANANAPTGYDTSSAPGLIAGQSAQLQPTLLQGTNCNFMALGVVRTGFSTIINTVETTPGQTPAFILTFRANFNYFLWQLALYQGRIEMPTGFASVTDYTVSDLRTNYAKYGLLYSNTVTVQDDFLAYIREMTARTDTEFSNAFLQPAATKDPSGKRKQKYDLIRAYYLANYGFDVQAIGNAR